MSEMTATSSSSTPSANDANAKIMKDIHSVKEKITLCQSLLGSTSGGDISTNGALLAVVGFLEACAPRMVELVEAASMSGVLSETTFEEVLQCNDLLQKTLADVETAAAASSETTTSADATAAAASTDLTDQFGDLLLDEPAATAATAPTAGPKTTGETAEDVQPATIPASSSNDEFDAFFAERQG